MIPGVAVLAAVLGGGSGFIPAIPDPNIANLVMRIHGDGPEGDATNIVDVLGNPLTRQPTGTPPNLPVITLVNKHWGRGSIKFPVTTSYITMAQKAAYAPGAGNFCITGWLWSTNGTANGGVFDLAGSSFPATVSNAIALGFKNSGFQLYAANTETLAAPFGFPNNQWTHFEVSRTGTTTRVFIGGVQVISVADSVNYTCQFFGINGIWTQSPGVTGGQLQELSYYVGGNAGHTSNFTPPAAPYLDS